MAVENPLQSILKILGLLLVMLVAACAPEPVRGPASEPVRWMESSQLRFDMAQGRAAAPIGVQPLLAAARPGQAEPLPMPSAPVLFRAFADVAPAGVEVALVASPVATSEAPESAPLAIVAIVELSEFEPLLSTAPEGTDGVTVLTTAGADVVLGSPFVAEFSPLQPLGLLQIDGRVINELQPHGYTRVLGFAEDQLGVVGRGGFHRGLFASALQVGPGIIEQGQLDISERELQLPAFFRTFLMNCGQRVVVGASVRPVHLRTLGSALVRFASDRSLACDEAVNLSGDREVLLGLRNGAAAVVLGNPRVKKTALIGFRARSLSAR